MACLMPCPMANRARIGTSGWEYRHWAGSFYPEGQPRDRWLEFYAEFFDTVELNNSFYRLPEADTFAAWARRAPDGFSFAVKASRYLTHLRRLKAPTEPSSGSGRGPSVSAIISGQSSTSCRHGGGRTSSGLSHSSRHCRTAARRHSRSATVAGTAGSSTCSSPTPESRSASTTPPLPRQWRALWRPIQLAAPDRLGGQDHGLGRLRPCGLGLLQQRHRRPRRPGRGPSPGDGVPARGRLISKPRPAREWGT
jgi:hypothetical protein